MPPSTMTNTTTATQKTAHEQALLLLRDLADRLQRALGGVGCEHAASTRARAANPRTHRSFFRTLPLSGRGAAAPSTDRDGRTVPPACERSIMLVVPLATAVGSTPIGTYFAYECSPTIHRFTA